MIELDLKKIKKRVNETIKAYVESPKQNKDIIELADSMEELADGDVFSYLQSKNEIHLISLIDQAADIWYYLDISTEKKEPLIIQEYYDQYLKHPIEKSASSLK